jgi:GH15 family glucan-1,4-alpha-glucosidase
MAHQPIENYGVIGDTRTVALVGMDGAIDFMCFPRFDSPSVFCALLDEERGGSFRLAPITRRGEPRQKQLYLPDTNVLITRFLFADGVAEVSDFMPVEPVEPLQNLVRRAKAVRGTIDYRMVCDPRFDYGRGTHKVERPSDKEALFIDDRLTLRLRSDVPLTTSGGAVVAEFTLHAGETAAFVLEEVLPGRASPSEHPGYVSENFKITCDFWRAWVARSHYHGRWRETVSRSALVLKLLTSSDYGSMLAAATFGLPEEIGGSRNWDYRYTWIRDASFSLYALIRLGYTDEAAAFMRWLEARCGELGPDGSLQIMYGIDGRHDLEEETLGHLRGYCNSQPVRIGNGASRQLQLDIYGELMDSVYLYDKFGSPVSHDLWQNLSRLVGFVCRSWRLPDEGIWEVRSGRQEFLFSRAMCWVAVDRAIRLANKRSLPAPMADWMKTRDEIYRDIYANFWSEKRNAFVQRKGSDDLDAANLLLPLVKFVSPTDPRWLSTLAAMEESLVQDSHVFRYRLDGLGPGDGIDGGEGTFNMCSFWYVEALARAGEVEKARFIFEKTLGYANHLGIYAEELGPRGEHLGNFPQAFSHIGLISAAYCLDRALTRTHRG